MADQKQTVSPYEADPSKIPSKDLYADLPFYGRYAPKPDDFKPEREHILSTSPESLKYWESVLALCNDTNYAYKNEVDEDGRDVFAVGAVIIKSGHLHKAETRPYELNDANEVAAVAIAREPLAKLGIRVPEMYFAGKINGGDVLIQERIPGVALSVASQYLSLDELKAFKEQARAALRALRDATPPSPHKSRSYIVPAPNPVEVGRIRQAEEEILWAEHGVDADLGFMHNDFTESNIIVDDGKIVGLVDWEMAGWFGWATTGLVHRQIRDIPEESFAHLERTEAIDKMLFWNDLYEV